MLLNIHFHIFYYSNCELTVNFAIFEMIQPEFVHFMW